MVSLGAGAKPRTLRCPVFRGTDGSVYRGQFKEERKLRGDLCLSKGA